VSFTYRANEKAGQAKEIEVSKIFLSLNFMHCMERFATQIYLTQKGAFKGLTEAQKLTDASENESGHVKKLKAEIKRLKGNVYPLGWLFQSMGVILGWATRLSGKSNLFQADTFVEVRAVKDYNRFLKAVNFDSNTVKTIRGIIADEETHILNWQTARKALAAKQKDAAAPEK
jgi:rubrerythrin